MKNIKFAKNIHCDQRKNSFTKINIFQVQTIKQIVFGLTHLFQVDGNSTRNITGYSRRIVF